MIDQKALIYVVAVGVHAWLALALLGIL